MKILLSSKFLVLLTFIIGTDIAAAQQTIQGRIEVLHNDKAKNSKIVAIRESSTKRLLVVHFQSKTGKTIENGAPATLQGYISGHQIRNAKILQ